MFNLLDENNFLHVFFNRVGDLVTANLLFVLCSVPVVTIGPALTALYHTMLKIVKGDGDKTAATFLRAFRENFLPSTAVWLLILLAAVITGADLFYFRQAQGAGRGLYLLSLVAAVLLGLFTLFVFPVIAAFRGSLLRLIKNAFLFPFLRFPCTLLLAALTVFPVFMTYVDLQLLPLSAFYWFFLGFGLTAYLNSFLFYRIFRPFLERAQQEGRSMEQKNPRRVP